MKVESLIFDIDGTLWDTRALTAQAFNLQLHEEGLDRLATNAEDLRPLFGKTDFEIGDVLFSSLPQDARNGLIRRCLDRSGRMLEEVSRHEGYPGVRQTLEALKKTHRLFIVSNSQAGYPQACIKKMGLEGLFQDTLCFGQTGTPKGRTLSILMERHHITSCAYIGDTQMDREATLEAGIPFIWAAYGFGKPESFDEKIQAFPDLLTLFA